MECLLPRVDSVLSLTVCTVGAMDRAGLHQTPCCNLLQGHHHTIHCGGFNSLHSSPFRLLWCPELEQQVAERRQESEVPSVGTSRGEWGGWQIRLSPEIKLKRIPYYILTSALLYVQYVCTYVCMFKRIAQYNNVLEKPNSNQASRQPCFADMSTWTCFTWPAPTGLNWLQVELASKHLYGGN